MRIILSPLGWLYGAIGLLRNKLYDRSSLKSHPLGARTISVGNITTGGTGKTPLVALVAEILAESGEKVCILTRGYGRANANERVLVSDGANPPVDAKRGGDEPVELAKRLGSKAIIIADADRVSAARWAKDEFGITAFVLDDGFQHRRAGRDIDIVCIDATRPFGNGRTLPAGDLREPLSSLSRADAVVITRIDLADNADTITSIIRRNNSRAVVLEARTRLRGFLTLDDFLAGQRLPSDEQDLLYLAGTYAFCGLGNPDIFFETLRQNNLSLGGVGKFPDHHPYTQADIEKLESEAKWSSSRSLITTAKDAVKLSGIKFELPCYVALADLSVNDPEAFRDLILSDA